MSIRAIAWAFEQTLPCAEKFVLVAVADMADQDGKCWPSQARLARMCGLARESVNRQLNSLVAKGFVTVERRVSARGKQTNLYFLQCDRGSHPVVTDDHIQMCATITPHVTDDHIEPSTEPRKKENPPTPPAGGKTAKAEFEEWWQECPRKVGKDAAARKYLIARRSTDAGTLLGAIRRYSASVASREREFIQHPATWLHAGRWKDEAEAPAAENGRDNPKGPPPPLTERELQMLETLKKTGSLYGH